MFERFSEPARQVVVLAQDEARALGHRHIGTEHLLLGLLRERDGLAARVLGSLGVTVESVRDRVGEIVGAGEFPVGNQIPFTPRAKKVLELSLREALVLGHNWIGTEHVLLGLVREGEGVGIRALRELGLADETIRSTVLEELGGPPYPTARWPRRPRRRPRRYEYRVIELGSPGELTEQLLEPLGADRWELVSVVPHGAGLRLVLKRSA
jgi:ATP-dependent Clp protease ATP-binding subunit ClpA